MLKAIHIQGWISIARSFVAYCLAQSWLALCITSTSGQPSLLASTHAGAAGKLDTARSRCLRRSLLIEDTVEPSFFLPGIISLFIMCVGIIRNNSLVGGRAPAGRVNPCHWARHAQLHMAAECANHSVTESGKGQGHGHKNVAVSAGFF